MNNTECPQCSGTGEDFAGWIPATWSTPAEPIWLRCGSCGGTGRVSASTARRLRAVAEWDRQHTEGGTDG